MASISLEEKRLKQLKQQLFGKEQPVTRKITKESTTHVEINHKQKSLQTAIIDPISLKADLIKITILSALAILIQFSLYFAIQNNLINLW